MKDKNTVGKKILSILTSVLLVINVLINSHFIYAEEVNNPTNIDVSITCDKKEVTPGEKVTFSLEYKAKNGPGSIKPGDTIEFNIPSWLQGMKFKYPHEHISDIKIVGDKAVATFGNDVEDALAGYITASAYASKSEDMGNKKIVVEVNGKPVGSVDITLKPSEKTETIYDRELRKTIYGYDYTDSNGTNTVGSIYSPVVGKAQTYSIYVNEKYSNISSAVLNDNMPEGMELLPGSINVTKIEIDGTETDVTNSLGINTSGNSLNINFGSISNKYLVTYKAKITKDYDSYNNVATLTKPDETLKSTVTINQKREVKDIISKYSYGSSVKEEGNQRITLSSIGDTVHYRIDINKNSSALNGVVLNDITPKGMELIGDSVTIGKYNKDGSFSWVTDDLKSNITTKGGNLSVNFGNIDDYYIVEYDMKINEVEDSYSNVANISYNGEEKTVKDLVEYEYNAGAINANKSVDKKVLEDGDNQSVVYTINFESFGVFQKGYLDLTDKIDPRVKIVKVEAPSQFTTSIDSKNNTVNVVNDKGQINYKENAQVKIYTDFTGVEDGTTIENVATINKNPTNKVETKKGYSFEATKVNNNNEKLEGAVFELQDSNKKPIKQLTSNSEGVIKSDLDSPGVYYLKEIKAPEGYNLVNDTVEVNVTKDDVGTIKNIGNIVNQKTEGKLQITKVDADDNSKLLSGAQFEIQNLDGKTLSTIITGENGVASISLEPGTYQAVEVKAPLGYNLSNEVQQFEIGFNQKSPVKLTFEDEKTNGSLEIKKVDSADSSKVLSGAEFEIQNTDGSKVDTIITGEDGLANISLKPGKYKAVEVKAPLGYNLSDDIQSFEIELNQKSPVKLTFEDTVKNGSLQIKKVDASDSSKVLSGAEFEIQNIDGSKVDSVTTGEDGLANISLKPGKYQAVEVKAPQGYNLSSEVQKFEIEFNQSSPVELTFEDTQSNGSLQIKKVDAQDNSKVLPGAIFEVQDLSSKQLYNITTLENGIATLSLKPGKYQVVETKSPEGYTLSDEIKTFEIGFNQKSPLEITFEDTQKDGRLEIKKVDSANSSKVLSGAEFEIQTLDRNKVDSVVTDENGVANLSLKPGKYQAVEVKAPQGYDLSDDIQQFEIEFNQSTPVQLTFKDTQKSGTLEIKKVDLEDSSKVLPGTEFEIQTLDGSKVDTIVTGANGVAKISLKPGDYQAIETKAPQGYNLSSEIQQFKIEFNQTSPVQLTFKDEKTNGSLQIKKVDSDDSSKVLSGAEFEIQTLSGDSISKIATLENGIASISLKTGKYQAVEVKAPEGYELSDVVQPFEIEFNQKSPVQLTFKDEKINGSLEIKKIDKDDVSKVLEGAEFEIQTPDGKKLDTITTDENGLANIDLKPGKYQAVEVKAPEGYELSDVVQPFEIEFNQKSPVQLIFKDEKTNGRLQIKKIDKDDISKVLEGAEFEIQTLEGKKVNTTTTNKSGIASIGLKPGKYQVIETKAPQGYALSSEVQKFEVEFNQKSPIELTFKDEKIDENTNKPKTNEHEDDKENNVKENPKTGDQSIVIYVMMGILAVIGFVFINKKK